MTVNPNVAKVRAEVAHLRAWSAVIDAELARCPDPELERVRLLLPAKLAEAEQAERWWADDEETGSTTT